ncbi:MAG: hypothetical protein KBT06_00660 [Prevotellaceae bacterium]|nr:hypothetical protein [Candidatus Colivivens equi]
MFNQLTTMPYIPYNIISHLAQDEKAEDFWKLLKYNEEDALSKPNLTLSEKLALVCKNNADQNDYSVFLTRLIENEQVEERSILKLYKTTTTPEDNIKAICVYAFDILTGAKTTIVEYNGIPCSRLDVMEALLVQSLNGVDVQGVGLLQYNRQLSRSCGAVYGIGNNTNYQGVAVAMAVRVSGLDDREC